MTTKSLVNATKMIAIYLVFLILYTMGIFPTLISLVLPLPIIIYSVQTRKLSELLLMFIACLLGSFLLTSFFGFLMTLLYGASGIILGWGFVKKWPYWQRILNSAILYMLGFPVIIYVLTGTTLTEASQAVFNESLNMLISMVPEAGSQFETLQNLMVTIVPKLMPTMLLLAGIAISFMSDLIAQLTLKRLRLEVTSFGDIRNFQLGRSLAMVYLGSQFGLLFINMTGIQVILLNIMLLLNVLFVVQGSIVLFSFFKKRNKTLPIFILVILFLFNATIALSMLGVMDALFDYRNRSKMQDL